MGNTLSTTVGYGFTLPYLGDDGDEELVPQHIAEMVEDLGDENSYELLEVLLKDYPDFVFEFPCIYDYYDAPVVYLKSTAKTFYGAHAHEFEKVEVSIADIMKVGRLSVELDGSDIGWFLVTSYG